MIWSRDVSRKSQTLVLALTLNWPSRRGSNSIILNKSKSCCLFVCLFAVVVVVVFVVLFAKHLIFRNRKTETKSVSIVQSHCIFAQIITCKQTRLCNSPRTITATSVQSMVSCTHTSSFTTKERASGSHCIRGRYGPTASMNAVLQGKNVLLLPWTEPRFLSCLALSYSLYQLVISDQQQQRQQKSVTYSQLQTTTENVPYVKFDRLAIYAQIQHPKPASKLHSVVTP